MFTIDEIDKALESGVLEVSTEDGKKVRFRSIEELIKAKKSLQPQRKGNIVFEAPIRGGR